MQRAVRCQNYEGPVKFIPGTVLYHTLSWAAGLSCFLRDAGQAGQSDSKAVDRWVGESFEYGTPCGAQRFVWRSLGKLFSRQVMVVKVTFASLHWVPCCLSEADVLSGIGGVR